MKAGPTLRRLQLEQGESSDQLKRGKDLENDTKFGGGIKIRVKGSHWPKMG